MNENTHPTDPAAQRLAWDRLWRLLLQPPKASEGESQIQEVRRVRTS